MNFFRCFTAAVCLLLASVSARAGLFLVDISTRTYSLTPRGLLKFQPGDARQFVNLAAQTESIDANTLVLVYDSDNDALEVVRKADGTNVFTVMTFVAGTEVLTFKQTEAFRQTFIVLSGTAMVSGSGSTVLSGSDTVSGSAAGPVHIERDHDQNITAYRWHGNFQYSIPADPDTGNRVVEGRFVLGRELRVKNTP